MEVFAGADVNYEPNLDDIEAARTDRTKAIIVTSPNNPTGAVWSERTIRDIAEWALDHNIWVISDEIYEHLTYDGVKTTHIGAAVPQIREQLIVLDGVAKTYAMPGWRVGWMVAPLAVAKRVQAAGAYDLQCEQHRPACRHRGRERPARRRGHDARCVQCAPAGHSRRAQRHQRRALPDAGRARSTRSRTSRGC